MEIWLKAYAACVSVWTAAFAGRISVEAVERVSADMASMQVKHLIGWICFLYFVIS